MKESETESPLLGIFWGLQEGAEPLRLVTDTTPLADGDRYGDFLTHAAGHLDVWEAWQRLGPNGLSKRGLPKAIAWHEYEHFPRGRVVYHCPTKRFTVYADRVLQSQAVVAVILNAFRLPRSECAIKSDPHYRSSPN
jgi:hypothetical protein